MAPPDTLKLALLKMSLTEKLETLKVLDSEIAELIDDEGSLTTKIDAADSFKEGIFAALIRIDKILTPAPEPTAPPSTTPTPPSHDHSIACDREATRANRVKLPKLTIQPFNGDLTSWTTFWDSFEAAIQKNEQLSDVDKFNYLHLLLEHTACEAISGLSLTSANYGEAISILKKRFASKQQIVNKHMDVLLNVEPVTSPQNVKGL